MKPTAPNTAFQALTPMRKIPALATDDGLLLIALAFILALGFVAVAQLCLPRIGFLTPPLRGPPALS